MSLPEYQLRISSRAKYARIAIKPDRQIEVVLPLGMPEREADKLVRAQQQWISQSLLRMQRQAPRELDNLPKRMVLRAIHQDIHVCYSSMQHRALVWHQSDMQLSVRQGYEDVPDLLRQWLKGYAKPYLLDALNHIATEMGVNYRALSVRWQKTRWGSCSARGNISLNAKLLLLPEDVLRYVLVHELSHLEYMNHSAAFWQHVAQFEPDYREKRSLLRQLSMRLPSWTHACCANS